MIDQFGRNDIQVYLCAVAADDAVQAVGVVQAGRARGYEAPTVDQRQGALRTQAIEVNEALGDAESRLRVGGTRWRRTERRGFAQCLADVEITPLSDGFYID